MNNTTNHHKINSLFILYAFLVFVAMVIVLAGLRYLCVRYCPGNLNDLLHDALFDTEIGMNPNGGQGMTVQERRALILASVLQKKVVKNKRNGEIDLPHEIQVSSDHPQQSSLPPTKSVTQPGNNDTGHFDDKRPKKEDILVQSIRRWRLSSRGKDDESVSSTMYSPKSCAICMAKYQDGDDICWSPNEKCCHAFHLNCMMKWLLKHDDCPLCRCNFLKSEKSINDAEGEQNP